MTKTENSVTVPRPHAGMRHVALNISNAGWERCVWFYTQVLSMQVEWQPDADNVYLTSGNDNVALHKGERGSDDAASSLDHLGFIIDDMDQVDVWYQFLLSHEIDIAQPPKTHRDGARSLYCRDPDGNLVQLIFHPPLSKGVKTAI